MKFEDKEYRNERINLNGNEFNRCKFVECEMVFTGVGAVALTYCNFTNCRWAFEGPAADTLAFMKAVYKMDGSGKDIVLATFKDIAPDVKIRH